jgi:hypothetical protein
MLHFLQTQQQQSIDGISAIASVQHLDSKAKRQSFFDLSYRALEYNGYLFLTNRSFSDRFLKKYWRACCFA